MTYINNTLQLNEKQSSTGNMPEGDGWKLVDTVVITDSRVAALMMDNAKIPIGSGYEYASRWEIKIHYKYKKVWQRSVE